MLCRRSKQLSIASLLASTAPLRAHSACCSSRAISTSRQLSSQLLDGLKGDKLHWRAAIMTHAWFNLVSPTPGEGDMMLEMLRVQMPAGAHG